MANIEWIQINATRFISKDGKFSIMPFDGEAKKWQLSANKDVNYTKLYLYVSLEDAFWGANNIWNGGR